MEPKLIATLVKPGGERIMAREKTALQEIEKLQEQIEKKREEALSELEDERREVAAKLREIEKQIADFTGKKVRATGTRQPKRCSICVAKGEPGTGHTKRTHAAWLKEQK